jgi:hypothetical protein
MKRRNILLCTLSVPLLHAQDDSFTGTPLVRVEADGTEVKRLEISPDAGAKAQCRIAKKGRNYIWASRGNRELIRSNAGDWTYFVSPDGSGYVKILKDASGPFDYLEHLTSEFKTFTYWGRRTG